MKSKLKLLINEKSIKIHLIINIVMMIGLPVIYLINSNLNVPFKPNDNDASNLVKIIHSMSIFLFTCYPLATLTIFFNFKLKYTKMNKILIALITSFFLYCICISPLRLYFPSNYTFYSLQKLLHFTSGFLFILYFMFLEKVKFKLNKYLRAYALLSILLTFMKVMKYSHLISYLTFASVAACTVLFFKIIEIYYPKKITNESISGEVND